MEWLVHSKKEYKDSTNESTDRHTYTGLRITYTYHEPLLLRQSEQWLNKLKLWGHRFRKEHTEEEYLAYRNKKVSNALESLKIYKALDQTLFEKGKQYKHILKLADGIT